MTRPDPATIDPEHYRLERYVNSGQRRAALRRYYMLKPLIPRRLQLALRRAYAPRQARRAFPAWPIEPLLVEHEKARMGERLREEGRDRVPFVARWPEGAGFAAVLTHDVEGPAGVDNVLRVQEVERRHGLVSSWNFVAEWYPIPGGLFDEVRARGGEIGLHGIKHDGRLFESRASFDGDLPKIHRYLAEWGAVGFRSPATHRNPDWIPELGCLYDSSFPDTDPYEPYFGGCCSIFPFLLGDLVELPITLVQDHTLWLILREPTDDLWTRKADWVIGQHGLVNLIVHPDYVVDARHLGRYESFCAWLRKRLDAATGWHALPRDVAGWWRARERMTVVEEDDGVRVAGPDPEPLARARVAWARRTGGHVVLDP